ncbi:MAG TPA: heme exporter protein CcmD [Luteimonas sp.]|nr:heme exporter protein CcmD [Luteimonas sp.]
MSYQNYVVAAYAVFAVVLLWDLVAPRIAIRQQLRAAKLRAARLRNDGAEDTGWTDIRPPKAPLSRE